jgi:DNA polymerase (family 10)
MDNGVLAYGFDELADLLELRGESAFKSRAYRNVADGIRELDEPLAALERRGELDGMPGVGAAIAESIREAFATGTFAILERERALVPTTLRDLARVSGFGLKTVKLLWETLGLASVGELLDACERNALLELPGFGKKKQERATQSARRILGRPPGRVLADACRLARRIQGVLCAAGADETAVTGEARRGVEIVRDLVILARGIDPARAARALDETFHVEMLRPGVMTVAADRGPETRVRLVPPDLWVQALLVDTGPTAHVRALEARAEKSGGLPAVCGRAEGEGGVYSALDLPYVVPELRERDSIEAPHELIEPSDIAGVFHVHTTWSDGRASLEEMIDAARRAGLTYVGISEHSKAASYAGGLDRNRLLAQREEVARVPPVRGLDVLHGIEVDVLADGSLDLDDEVLKQLDFVIASVHSEQDMPRAQMTARILRAVRHPLVTILGHPTGRLLLAKPAFEFDLEAVATAAAENDTYLEINANAQRLDLAPDMIRRAHKCGARFAINPDAHEPSGFEHIPYGVVTARRAGLSRSAVLNACDARTVRERLRARRERALERLSAR